MKKLTHKHFLAACLLLFIISKGISQTREQVFTGTRPLGMGETLAKFEKK